MEKKVIGCFRVTSEAEEALRLPLAGGLPVIDWREKDSLFVKISLVMWREVAVQMILEDAAYASPGWEVVYQNYYMKWDRELALTGQPLLVSLTTSNSSRSGRHGDQHVLVVGVNPQLHYAVKDRWSSAASTGEDRITLRSGGVRTEAIGYRAVKWPDWKTFAQSEGWGITKSSRYSSWTRDTGYQKEFSQSFVWEVLSPDGERKEVLVETGQPVDYLQNIERLHGLYQLWDSENWKRPPGPLGGDKAEVVNPVSGDSLKALVERFKK